MVNAGVSTRAGCDHAGSYRYIGELALRFTPDGHLKKVLPSSRIHRVASTSHAEGVADDSKCLAEILTPLKKGWLPLQNGKSPARILPLKDAQLR